MNGGDGGREAAVSKRRRWSAPRIIHSAEAVDSGKLTTTFEHYVNPGYAFPRTVGPNS